VKDRIRQSIATTLAVPVEQVPPDAALGEYSKWDSLAHLELMLALESEFGVRIPMEAMVELTSIRAIEQFLADKGIGETT
jgi:acyl carrier protein